MINNFDKNCKILINEAKENLNKINIFLSKQVTQHKLNLGLILGDSMIKINDELKMMTLDLKNRIIDSKTKIEEDFTKSLDQIEIFASESIKQELEDYCEVIIKEKVKKGPNLSPRLNNDDIFSSLTYSTGNVNNSSFSYSNEEKLEQTKSKGGIISKISKDEINILTSEIFTDFSFNQKKSTNKKQLDKRRIEVPFNKIQSFNKSKNQSNTTLYLQTKTADNRNYNESNKKLNENLNRVNTLSKFNTFTKRRKNSWNENTSSFRSITYKKFSVLPKKTEEKIKKNRKNSDITENILSSYKSNRKRKNKSEKKIKKNKKKIYGNPILDFQDQGMDDKKSREVLFKINVINTKLDSINLAGNKITDKGAFEITLNLSDNFGIKKIDFSRNLITDAYLTWVMNGTVKPMKIILKETGVIEFTQSTQDLIKKLNERGFSIDI